ncbi:MAG: hypothetical protein HZC06_07330 [Methylocystis sp.]|nr:hypothetical protein [Methylocystis sp.]
MKSILQAALLALVAFSVFAAPADAAKSHRQRRPVAVVADDSSPSCLGGYLAQTEAQDYLRDDIWVLEPVPGSDNRPYRFDCRQPVFLRR